jgi:fructose-bisphosphate aldolase class II
MRVTSNQLYQHAYGKFAIGAYNICSLEQFHGLFRGAREANSPIIVQFTGAAREYAHPQLLAAMMDAAEKIYPGVVYAVHLDHGTEALCEDAIASGDYTSVMIDASHLPFAENIRITKSVVEKAHRRGIPVEAELGVLAGIEDDKSIEEQDARFTDPNQAAEFVQRTGCDSLAVAIGTSHGAYKFSGEPKLHVERLAEIQQKLPGFPLVLHGASAVPPDEIDRINAAGGKMKAARGTDVSQLQQTIRRGICKVNIGTDGRLVWTRVHREFFRDQPEQYDFSLPGKIYMKEYADFVVQKSLMLGSAGQAGTIKSKL